MGGGTHQQIQISNSRCTQHRDIVTYNSHHKSQIIGCCQFSDVTICGAGGYRIQTGCYVGQHSELANTCSFFDIAFCAFIPKLSFCCRDVTTQGGVTFSKHDQGVVRSSHNSQLAKKPSFLLLYVFLFQFFFN